MCSIVTSRFNNLTWEENREFRERLKINGCIYGPSKQITEKIPLNSLVFVIEMNNTINRIEGIGLIRNLVYHGKKLRLYQSGNYNRYIYKGNYRLDRSQLMSKCPQIVNIIEQMVFTGKTHLKRGRGFTRIPEKLYIVHRIAEHYNLTEILIKNQLISVFKTAFSNDIQNEETFSD